MKRKLIRGNKRWLMKKYHQAQQLYAPLSVILASQKIDSAISRSYRLWRRGLIKEDWEHAVFGNGFVTVPHIKFDGSIVYHDRIYDKSLVPIEYQKQWLNLHNKE